MFIDFFCLYLSKDLAALIIPGGFSPDYLRRDKRVLDLVRGVTEAGKRYIIELVRGMMEAGKRDKILEFVRGITEAGKTEKRVIESRRGIMEAGKRDKGVLELVRGITEAGNIENSRSGFWIMFMIGGWKFKYHNIKSNYHTNMYCKKKIPLANHRQYENNTPLYCPQSKSLIQYIYCVYLYAILCYATLHKSSNQNFVSFRFTRSASVLPSTRPSLSLCPSVRKIWILS